MTATATDTNDRTEYRICRQTDGGQTRYRMADGRSTNSYKQAETFPTEADAVAALSPSFPNLSTATIPAGELFTINDATAGYTLRRWHTTEDNARRWHREQHPTCQLIGRGGLIISAGYRLSIVNDAAVWTEL